MRASYALREIVARLGGEIVGDGDVVVYRMASLAKAGPGDLSFFADSRHRAALAQTQASAVVVDSADLTVLPRIVTDNPYAYFARVSALLHPVSTVIPGVHPAAVVDPSATVPASVNIAATAIIGRGVILGEHVVIGPGCVVGEGVRLGDNTCLHARVVVYPGCVLGRDCIVQSGAVIGSDGFGYAHDRGQWVSIPQTGRVVIGNGVDIGANTTIDRGTLEDTLIEDGVKLDNLIQIGHNCRIGAHTVIAGCVGIAGSASIGRHCRIGGAAMILGHLEIADDVTVSPGTMITRSLSTAGTYTALMPFQTHDKWLRTAARLRHLDGALERLTQLEQELDALKKGRS